MLAEPDKAIVGRIVRRVGAYMENGEIGADALDTLFEMFGADARVRDAVTQGLGSTGVIIIGTAVPSTNIAVPPPETTPLAPPIPSKVAPRNSGNRSLPANTVSNAGMAVIEMDRRHSKPWTRLLTAEQEVGLGTLMRGPGVPLDAPLPKGYRKALDATDIRAEAFDAMLLHNRGLVWSLIAGHLGHGLDAEDLEQSGYEGLRRAIELFDGSRGLKFSTYATHWINQSMSRAVANDGRLIRLPVHMHERVNRVRAVRNRLVMETGRAALFDLCREADLKPEQVIECLRLSAGAVSLDMTVGEDTSLLELLEAEDDPDANPLAHIIGADFRADLQLALEMLGERESYVLRMRFGFLTDEPETLDAIGRVLGVSRERIRQIESKAKARLERLLVDQFPHLVWMA